MILRRFITKKGCDMLEQFRILAAALRLREFGVAELAQASGVAESTVQKTLQRKSKWFSNQLVPNGRRGGQPKRYKIDEEVVRGLLQGQVDALDLPKLDDGLGAALAEDTMCRVLPRVPSAERASLLATVHDHLQADGERSGKLEALRDLYRVLCDLVAVEAWLERWVAFGMEDEPQIGRIKRIKWTINALLSADEADRRKNEPSCMLAAAKSLSALPALTLMSVVRAGPFFLNVTPAPIERWWLAVPAGVWTLLRNEFWKELSGDLTEPNVLTSFVDLGSPPKPLPQNDTLGNIARGVVVDTNVMVGLMSDSPWLKKNPSAFEKGMAVIFDPAAGYRGLFDEPHSSADPKKIAEEIVRINADTSASGPMFVDGGIEIYSPPEGLLPTVKSMDFHFGLRRVMGAVLMPPGDDPQKKSYWREFVGLVLAGDERRRHTSAVERLTLNSDAGQMMHSLPRLPFNFGELIGQPMLLEGLYLPQFHNSRIQVRFNPGHTISVYDRAMLDDKLARADAKSGEVWWLDLDMNSGRILFAHVRQNSGDTMLQIPFDDLRYDFERRAFFLMKSPGVSENSDLAVAAARGKLERRPDRFH
jgi:hypothetical protein